ncbi:hypothetical protein JCM16814_28380 [Desulfobaculum senezii]
MGEGIRVITIEHRLEDARFLLRTLAQSSELHPAERAALRGCAKSVNQILGAVNCRGRENDAQPDYARA